MYQQLPMYQQLVPTKLYNQNKTRTDTTSDAMYRMCHEFPESITHVIAGCSALAQTKYVARHNEVLKILFFELLDDLQHIESVPRWYSPTTPKPEYTTTPKQAHSRMYQYSQEYAIFLIFRA